MPNQQNSNLQTATEAIEAEIAHAKTGLAHYAARVAVLEQTLAELRNVDQTTDASVKPAKSEKNLKATPKAPKKQPKLKGAKRAKQSKRTDAKLAGATRQEGDLPSTGGDYWENLITDQPQHSSAVLKSAVDQLGFAPTQEQVKKLAQRMTFALNTLAKTNKIQDSGSGRERVFFKK
jgi:hypothetical protein